MVQIAHRDAISGCQLDRSGRKATNEKGQGSAVQEFLPPCTTDADATRVMHQVENTAAELLRRISAGEISM